jgi:hypothetical protein
MVHEPLDFAIFYVKGLSHEFEMGYPYYLQLVLTKNKMFFFISSETLY